MPAPSTFDGRVASARLRAVALELHRRIVKEPAGYISFRAEDKRPGGKDHWKQAKFLRALHQIVVAIGANRTGKTKGVVYKCVTEFMGWSPELTRHYGKLIVFGPRRRVWVVSKDFDVSFETVQKDVRLLLPPEEIKKKRVVWTRKDQGWQNHDNGSVLTFKSVEEGRAAFQGTSQHLIAFDEEPKDEEVYDECYARTLDVGGQIAFSFTAVNGSRWLHNLINDPKQDVFKISIGMIDNPHLPPDVIEMAARRYKGDDYRIRVKGDYILRYGRPYYDRESLDFQADNNVVDSNQDSSRTKNPEAVKAGKTFFEGTLELSNTKRPKLVHSPGGPLRIYRMPRKTRTYAIGSDSSGGDTEGDFSCAQVLDVHSNEQVAVWHGHVSPSEFGYALFRLATLYNNAMLAPETNWHGSVTLHVLTETLQYGNIYVRQLVDRLASETAARGARSVPRLGWYTDRRTKPLMCGVLRDLLQSREIILRDVETVDELRAFGYEDEAQQKFGLAALSGHDDRVDALAIAAMCLQTAPRYRTLEIEPEEEIGDVMAVLAMQDRQHQEDDGLDGDGFPPDAWDNDYF